jgi:NAD(P)-dependent dehydrogenase (short-subunit alcohol dehydrogenase family)
MPAIQVNNASSQWPKENLEDITDEQLELTFRTNIFSMFYMARYLTAQLAHHEPVFAHTGS